MNIARVSMSYLVSQLDGLLVNVSTTQLDSAQRRRHIRSAVIRLAKDRPKRNTVEFNGDGGMYYLLFGDIIGETFKNRDAYLALTATDTKKAFQFTTTRELEISAIVLQLSRIGATVDGDLIVKIYSNNSNPDIEILSSRKVTIGERNGVPQGIYGEVQFPLDEPFILPAGIYFIVVESDGYTYGSGTSEIRIGVLQSGATNNAWTYTGSWAEESTASQGHFKILSGLPGWASGSGSIDLIEYPAADISNDESPEILTADDYAIISTQDNLYLRFSQYAPSSTELIRITYAIPYQWLEENDPTIDIPYDTQDALCYLAAYYSCIGLATRYGQNINNSLGADSIDRKSQSADYRLLAKEYLATYQELIKSGSKDRPGIAYADFDKSPITGRDYLFHRR